MPLGLREITPEEVEQERERQAILRLYDEANRERERIDNEGHKNDSAVQI
jgi:hypothetical protein